ncbi:MAG: thiol reductant ABC exporter subunit CydC [Balneolaceae bacterium]|nr:thiol reductant ABC exporter subunit CydC [Balneolaceae bacterium]
MMRDFSEVFSELMNLKGRASLSLLLGSLTVMTGVGLIAASGYLISWAALRPPILDLILVLVAVRFFGISRAAFRYAERLFSHDLTFRILKNLRVHFYEKLEPLLPGKAIQYRSADLLSRFSDDVDQLQEFYLKTIAPVLTALFFIVLTAIIISWYSQILGLTVFTLMVLNAFLMPVFIRYKAGKSARDISVAHSGLSQYMNDHVRGATDLLFSGYHREWVRIGEDKIEELAAIQLKRAGAFGMDTGLFTFLSNASLPISFILLLPLVLDGAISGLVMTAIVLGIFSVFEAMEPVGSALQHYIESKEAAGRIKEVTSSPDKVLKESGGDSFKPQKFSVVFDNVSFGYGSNPVIKELNLQIHSGEHALLMGPSGCGKSTIAHLLVKWFEPWKGEVRIGSLNTKNFRGSDVRKYITVVGQHTRLFNTSLRNNLKIADPDASDADLVGALNRVGFSKTLKKLPEGLNTQVGELGLRLSGGERQRVALARALLKDAPIWILDEPLSNLDREMADEIMQTLQELIEKKTVLHITHQNRRHFAVDKVYSMKEGAVCEELAQLI